MKNEIFYQYLDQSKPRIQSLAAELANDFATARFLYHETAHQAMKNKENLKEEIFQDWLVSTMKKTYYSLGRISASIRN